MIKATLNIICILSFHTKGKYLLSHSKPFSLLAAGKARGSQLPAGSRVRPSTGGSQPLCPPLWCVCMPSESQLTGRPRGRRHRPAVLRGPSRGPCGPTPLSPRALHCKNLTSPGFSMSPSPSEPSLVNTPSSSSPSSGAPRASPVLLLSSEPLPGQTVWSQSFRTLNIG